MGPRNVELKIIRVEYECGCEGEMRSSPDDNVTPMTNAKQFRHMCEKCGQIRFLDEEYPHLEYVPKG